MALASGTHLGPYEILALIGAGGMGEVYRARDPRLGREVAIKVLPATYSRDPDRLRRFEQEARAAGVLNHPNILAIYDVGTHDGSPYVVSELLEGETLRERLGSGRGATGATASTPAGAAKPLHPGHALPPRKAIDYAIQAAHGLAAAHAKGITHRDLKPENLFITTDGRVKILDFGLAKLVEPVGAGADKTSAPTMTSGTEPGVVMGTVGYMSPEQVRGQPADHRSDIFSFGVILYEMLTGQRAFQRDSSVETMSAILKEEPPDVAQTGANIPPGLERVVGHCLEKQPDERFQSARDLGFALEALSGTSSAAVSGATPALEGAGRTAVPPPAKAVLATAVVALLTLALGYYAGHRTAGPGAKQAAYHRVTFGRGTVFAARFAPDGKTIAYSASWAGGPTELYTVRTEFPESRAIGLSGVNLLGVSSSGEMAVIVNGEHLPHGFYRGTLARASLSGGTPRELLNDVAWADWSADGANLAVVHLVGGKCRLEFPIGKVLYETTGWVSHPRISPKGDKIAFLDHPVWPDDRGSVAVIDLSGKKTTLSTGWASEDGLAWSPSGDEVWFSASPSGMGRSIHAVTLPGRVRSVASVAGGTTLQDIFPDGRVLLTRDNERVGTLALAPGEKTERDLSWLDWSIVSDISADGKTIVFSEEGEGGGSTYAACIRKTDGSPPVRLGEGSSLTISPDGQWIISDVPGNPERLVLLPTGAGAAKTVGAANLETYDRALWLPNGTTVAFDANEAGHDYRIYLQDVDGGTPKPLTPEGTKLGLVFPDSKQVLGVDSQRKWWIYPVAGGEPRPVAGIQATERPIQWSSDGRSLYVAKFGPAPLKVYMIDLASQQSQLWKEFSPAGHPGLLNVGPIYITPDGRADAYSYSEDLSDLYLADGLK